MLADGQDILETWSLPLHQLTCFFADWADINSHFSYLHLLRSIVNTPSNFEGLVRIRSDFSLFIVFYSPFVFIYERNMIVVPINRKIRGIAGATDNIVGQEIPLRLP